MPRKPAGWRPDKDQAEMFADMVLARMPIALIAGRFGTDAATLRGYLARLAAADTYAEPIAPPPPPPPQPPVPVPTRITAKMVFERDDGHAAGAVSRD